MIAPDTAEPIATPSNGYANGSRSRVVDVPPALEKLLHPNHYEDLAKSGLTVETILAAGLHSEAHHAALATLLGWKNYLKRMGSALVFPYVDRDGRELFTRIKPDRPRIVGRSRKPVKYEQPRGVSPRPYVPRGVWATIDSPGAELLVTEGEKKALAATQAGFPTIGLSGVFAWMDPKGSRLCPDLAAIKWAGRPVFIAFDSDAATNPNVEDAELRLAAALRAEGAIVKIVRLPFGPEGDDGRPAKVGLDDFLVARGENGPAELRKMMDAAEEPDEPKSAACKVSAKDLDAATEARAFLERHSADGIPRIRFYRGSWWLWSRGRYAEVAEADVQAMVVAFLDEGYGGLTRSRIADVMVVAKALARLSSTVEAPAWIDESPDWPADECLATPTTIVHVPSLVAGEPHSIEATPRFFNTNAIEYEFDEHAPAPAAWLAFLESVWPHDPASIETLRQWFGLSLSNDTRHQKILALIGPKRSGKGTICRILRDVIGPSNVAGPTLGSLGERFGLWPLLGKSLAIFSDARLSGRADQATVVERLLSISGEDALTVDRKNLPPTTQKLGTRLMLVSNELPRLSDASGALASRLILLKPERSFYGREDHDLTRKLTAELPSILLWALGGWERLRDRGHFIQPDGGRDLLDEMHDLSSPVSAFVRDCCVIHPARLVAVDELFDAWKGWCESQGRREPGTVQTFGRDFAAAFPEIRKTRPRDGEQRFRAYEGIGLKLA